jgi:hypothetical protein
MMELHGLIADLKQQLVTACLTERFAVRQVLTCLVLDLTYVSPARLFIGKMRVRILFSKAIYDLCIIFFGDNLTAAHSDANPANIDPKYRNGA